MQTIVVASLPRTGSSMVAGILHTLGVDMGESMIGANEHNEKGHFEDHGLFALHNAILVNWISPSPRFEQFRASYHRAIRERDKRAESMDRSVWGYKDCRFIFCYPLLREIKGPDEVKLVVVNRPIGDSVTSIMKQNNWSANVSMTVLSRYRKRQREMLAETDWPVLQLDFKSVVDDPERHVAELAEFCGHGPSEEQVRQAVEFVEPRLVHY